MSGIKVEKTPQFCHQPPWQHHLDKRCACRACGHMGQACGTCMECRTAEHGYCCGLVGRFMIYSLKLPARYPVTWNSKLEVQNLENDFSFSIGVGIWKMIHSLELTWHLPRGPFEKETSQSSNPVFFLQLPSC